MVIYCYCDYDNYAFLYRTSDMILCLLLCKNSIFVFVDTIPLDIKYEFEGYDLAILGSKFPYGFEYMSERASLILSPLTERCFMTLSLALQQYSCGTLIGFYGSGKTETIKELGKVGLCSEHSFHGM